MRPVANKKIAHLREDTTVNTRARALDAGTDAQHDMRFTESLANRGFRLTRQRQQVYDVLLEKRDHPTAEEVFIRAKRESPNISMATVYNCLTALVKCGLVKQVALERGASRYCPNMHEHCHFYCDACDSVFDINFAGTAGIPLPRGFAADRFDIAIHGHCPDCSKTAKGTDN
jgi:Fur family peroxide stress response transcriptional regulator